MEHDPSKASRPDPNRPRVAPAPPPAPAALSKATQSKGFDPKGSKLVLEMALGIFALLLLGIFVVKAGGTIAAWATPLVPWSVDKNIGKYAEQSNLGVSVCDDPSAQEYVEAIGARILEPMGKQPITFHYRVADTDEVNAFALPGGYVTVNWGLIKEAQSGEEIAGVLGHEIQHALLRHGTKRILRQVGGSAVLALIFGGSDAHGLAQAAANLTSLSYDRDEESEADLRGVDLLLRAKIDPAGLSTLFSRLDQSPRPPELLSSHPDPGKRAQLVSQSRAGASFLPLPPPMGIRCHKGEP